MENIVNEVENLEEEMDLNDVKVETTEKKEPEYRVSKKKVAGILLGVGAVAVGILGLIGSRKNNEETEA